MQNPENLKAIRKVHFIGIGGIGVSAIARMMMLEGKEVSGSDQSGSLVVEELKKLGAKIQIGHKAQNVPKNCGLVVYTIAIPNDNPELVLAQKEGIQTLTYPEMLGLISAQKYTIAVAGTHGKTTTTAMLAKIFMEAEKDPTVIVGSLLREIKTNFIAGQSKYFIAEACEYRRSFLNLHPQIVVITNIDNDHLDYYKDLKDIQKAFGELAAKIPDKGALICDTNDKRLQPVIKKAKCRIIDYPSAMGSLANKLILKVPGSHMEKDAKAAFAAARVAGIAAGKIIPALNQFSGTWRRFEYKGIAPTGAAVYDDYAHHPTEIQATLETARILAGDERLAVVFQPHLYSRTKLLLKDFAKSFKKADLVIIPDIYAAREKKDKTIHSRDLAADIKANGTEVLYIRDFAKIVASLKKKTNSGDIVVTMGAGDIFRVGEDLISSH